MINQTHVQTLSEWLAIATRDLTAASKDRIRLEIEAHYAEAVEAHRANGESESDAQASALAQLGDAHAAAKRFRRRHLTEREEKRLKAADKYGRSVWSLLGNYSMYWLSSICIFRKEFAHLRNSWAYLILLFVLFIAIPTAGLLVARFSRTRPNRHLLWMEAANGFGPLFFLYLMFSSSVSPSESAALKVIYGAMLFLPSLPRFLTALHICVKIGRRGTNSTNTPPPAEAEAS